MTNDKLQRKERPIARGVLDYFPDAIADVAHVSCVGGRQHNIGGELKWDRSKSPDHADCIARHLLERGTLDTDGCRHSAKVAWRALAMLQIEIEIENDFKATLQQAAKNNGITVRPAKPEPPAEKFFDRPEREYDFYALIRLGCPDQVARQIVMGTTYSGGLSSPYVYLAGPMRGLPGGNFAAFDQARDLVKQGYNVISPADIDRSAGDAEASTLKATDQRIYAFRDFWALYFIAQFGRLRNAIVMLRNWEKSTGATAEYGIAKWLGLNIREIGECVPSSSATCMNQSPIPATYGSAKTYAIEKSVRV